LKKYSTNLNKRQHKTGSLFGAKAFKKVTKAYKGKFKFCRKDFQSAMVYICLTVRQIGRTEIQRLS